MISAVSGSNASALLALFGRGQADASATPTQTAQRDTPPPPRLPQGLGATAQSLFDALVQDAKDKPQGKDAASLGDLVSNLMASLDTDGDGKLSADELQSALSGAATEAEPAQTSAKSLYESLFNAMASDDGSRASAVRKNDVAQKFLSMLEA